MQLDPRYPAVFVYYKGLALFAQDRLPESIRTFEKALQLNPDLPWLRLYLASAYARSGKVAEATAMLASFNQARVKQGDLPFTMNYLQVNNYFDNPALGPVPEMPRLIRGLREINIPYDFSSKVFDRQRLTSAEIDAPTLGHRIHGLSVDRGLEHGAFISADGSSVMAYGDWSVGSGSAQVKNNQLCLVWSSTFFCSDVLRNAGGTETPKKTNIFCFSMVGNDTFSRVD